MNINAIACWCEKSITFWRLPVTALLLRYLLLYDFLILGRPADVEFEGEKKFINPKCVSRSAYLSC